MKSSLHKPSTKSPDEGTLSVVINMFRSIRFGVIELFAVTISVSRRVISVRSARCLSKLERVKANSIERIKIVDK
jgi:hypothetical protein